MFRAITVAVVVLLSGAPLALQGPAVDPRVDALFADWNTHLSPGCSVGVSRNGAVVYARGFGLANVETGTPLSADSVFHVASVSKQFTAASILLLAQQGRLSIDDSVRRYIPELPDYGRPLTIRHLLTHTGGLRDEFLLRELASPRTDIDDPNAALVRLLAQQRALNYAPGSEYQYSNAGYTLLATIVRRVSGQTLRAFADDNIFKPLGMTHTHVHDDPSEVVPGRASGYSKAGDRVRVAVRADPGGLVGNTGVFTTVGDLLRWEANFATARVGDPAWLAAMQAPTRLSTGEMSPYGFGLQIGDYRGLKAIGHGGNDQGASAEVIRYPEKQLAIAVLCNLDSIDAVGLSRRIADVMLDGQFPSSSVAAPKTPVHAAAGPGDHLEAKAGLYRDPTDHALMRVFVRDGKLMASGGSGDDGGFELVPAGSGSFVAAGTVTMAFLPAGAAVPLDVHITDEHGKTQQLKRLEPVPVDANALRAYAGRYESLDLDTTYTVAVRDGGLVLEIPGRKSIALKPAFRDGFSGEIVGIVEFARDGNGTLTGLSLQSYAVRALPFTRIDSPRPKE